jgi:hypothetical protein
MGTPSKQTTEQPPLFELGQLCYTLGAQDVLQRYQVNPFQLLTRHVTGDWGDLCKEDADANNEALKEGTRIFSAYVLPPPVSEGQSLAHSNIWVITEADQSVTTILLPEEY